MLSDGRTTFTPGVSEAKGIGNGQYASEFYLSDRQGNSRGLLNGGQGNTDGYNWDGFGVLMNRLGSNPTAYGWGEGSGYQTDNDSGLRLLGHRYYDSRTGRFISQDPIGDGTNWYAYCDNNPTLLTDASGLLCAPFDSTGMSLDQMYDHVAANGGLPGEEYQAYDQNGKAIPGASFTVSGFSYGGQSFVAPYGTNINTDISRARNFYASRDSQSPVHSGWHGMNTTWKHDPKKIGDWMINHYGPGTAGDPKTMSKHYDKYGHAAYAAAGSELRITLGTLLGGEIEVHDTVHPSQPGEEENGEYAGWGYDQHNYHPGAGIYTDSDFIASGVGFVWQYVNGIP